MADLCLLTLLALTVEVAVGYPDWLWRAVGHPVSWMGRIIGWADARLNVETASPGSRRTRGALALGGLLLAVGMISGGLQLLLFQGLGGLAVLAILCSSLFAQRSLHAHVAAVADALDRSVAEGRVAVAKIVGRDVEVLDAAGVARAAIESLAENFSDGIVAPALWTAVAGLPGGALYKAINTADSMVGHRTARYEDFGKAAARIDDVVNWPAARISGLLLVGAALLRPGSAPREAWAAIWRDAANHRSPNAGWPEAAMAGGLRLQLAGPRWYTGVPSTDGFMGNGRREADSADVRAALSLYRRAVCLVWLLLALVAVLLV